MIGLTSGSVEILQIDSIQLYFCQVVSFARRFTTTLPGVNPPPVGAGKADDAQRKGIPWREIADKSIALICYTPVLLVSCIGVRNTPCSEQ
ncbi:hypothetical protein CXF96_13525 [Stenotrophomonas sp. Betaine-02u-21]|nr:hypothetical protein CXF96_13525 [Stenotrophomonas sp. Betaine-02u-21]